MEKFHYIQRNIVHFPSEGMSKSEKINWRMRKGGLIMKMTGHAIRTGTAWLALACFIIIIIIPALPDSACG
jgi:hypothetical protein